jgi:hypothetical protein
MKNAALSVGFGMLVTLASLGQAHARSVEAFTRGDVNAAIAYLNEHAPGAPGDAPLGPDVRRSALTGDAARFYDEQFPGIEDGQLHVQVVQVAGKSRIYIEYVGGDDNCAFAVFTRDGQLLARGEDNVSDTPVVISITQTGLPHP